MEQLQLGLSDSNPKVGSGRFKKSAKSLMSTLQLITICQINTQKYWSGHFDPF